MQWFSTYSRLLSDYMRRDKGIGMDLTLVRIPSFSHPVAPTECLPPILFNSRVDWRCTRPPYASTCTLHVVCYAVSGARKAVERAEQPVSSMKSTMGRAAPAQHLSHTLCCWLQDTQPPKAPDMFVRVLQDCGNVAFSTGSVTLRKGSTHFLPQAEADHLIQEGVLAPSESGPIEAFTTPFDYI